MNEERMMKKFTKEQALVIMGFTGISTTSFSTFHGDVEKRLGHPVWTHQFADNEFVDKVAEAYREDFLAMCSADYEAS
jgi:hypothetical protein